AHGVVTHTTHSCSPPARRYRRLIGLAAAVLLLWAVVAYLVIPAWWKRYTHRPPALEQVPADTQTASGRPASPLNVALGATKEDLVWSMIAAKRYPPDLLSLKSP